MNGMLKGLRVIEGSAFVAAPLAGMTLAQMGAEVIRFDPVGGGLDYRRWPVDANGNSLYWVGLNKGKRSVAIDIRRPEGRELATALVQAPGDGAGLFLTNFPASGWLGYDRLRQGRPDLVMVNVKGNRDGSSEVDYTVNPATGLPFMTGPAGAGPVNHVLPAWDIATGLSAVNGLLAAERRRRETGEGQLVEVALSDVAFAMMGALGFIGEAAVNGVARGQGGNDLFGAFGRDFETADGRRVMVVGLTGRQWQALKQATGLQAEITALAARLGLDLEQEGDRYRAGAGIAALLEPWCRARSHAEVARVFTEAGVAWSTYRTLPEALAEDPRCSADGPLFTTLEQPGMGSFPVPGSPVDFSGEARLPPVRAPRLGEHTDQVLAEVLGLSSHRIGELHDAGLVAGPD